jgi:hypothetical protein
MAHDVFISYSIKDKAIADAICAHLEAAGMRCWIAPRDITAGEDWPTAITRAISQGRVLVLVFSAHSNSSDDVSRELFLAANHKLVIIPFKIENIEPEPGKNYYLARTHWLDALNPPTQEQIQNLVERVRTLVPLKGTATPVAQTTSAATPGIAVPAPDGKQPSGKRRGAPWLWAVPVGIILIGLFGWAASSLYLNRPAAPTQTTQPVSAAATLPAVITPTLPPALAPTISPTILPEATATATAGVKAADFTKSFVADPFNDNSLEWPVGNSNNPNWQGTLAIANGILDWQGNSLARMNALIHPGLASLQDNLTDQEVSARINLTSQNGKGIYGLYFRGSADGNHFYVFNVYDSQFGLFLLNGENNWKSLSDWAYSPTVKGAGWVKMSVQAVGSHFRLLVNDQLLTELDDSTLASGQSGLMVTAYTPGTKIQAQFDDFTILVPSP